MPACITRAHTKQMKILQIMRMQRTSSVNAYPERLHLQAIKMQPLLDTTNKSARNAFAVCVGMQTLDDVAGVVADLPDSARNEAPFPTHCRERELASKLIHNPI